MAGPAQITIEFGGSDPLVSEGIREVWYAPNVALPGSATSQAMTYILFRQQWLARSLFIIGVKASMIGIPRFTDSIAVQRQGTATNPDGSGSTRDDLSAGLVFNCFDAGRLHKSRRTFRGFPDDTIQYDPATGQEKDNPQINVFGTALLAKITELGWGLKGIDRNPVVAKPKVVDTVTTSAANVLLSFTSAGAAAEAAYQPGVSVSISGAAGTQIGNLNGTYTILKKTGSVFSIKPRRVQRKGFDYDDGSARVSLNVPAYLPITVIEYDRFGSRKPGAAINKHVGRNK